MSLIASFDLSLNSSGVCILPVDKGTPVHYENISSNLSGIERLEYNYNRYMNIFSTYRDIGYISYEGQNAQMRFSYHAGSLLALAENVGVFKLAIYHSLSKFIVPPLLLEIPAQDIKKYATGNGAATKEEMIAAVNGTHIKSIRRDIPEHSVNDICDAYHLAKMTKDIIVNNKDLGSYLMKDYRIFEKV